MKGKYKSIDAFVATFQTGEQYTEQNWRPINPTLAIGPETTVREIQEWYRTIIPEGRMEVRIIQLQGGEL